MKRFILREWAWSHSRMMITVVRLMARM
jgi:hypothetical protein